MNFHRISPLDHPSVAAAEARVDFFDTTYPYWEQAVAPERFVSESDLPVYDTTADAGRVPNEDWEAMGDRLARFSDWN